MTTNILFTSKVTMFQMPGYSWKPKSWLTRDGRNTVYWTVTDAEPPAGFTADDHYAWTVDGAPATAYFTSDVLAGWHSEGRGGDRLSTRPAIMWAAKAIDLNNVWRDKIGKAPVGYDARGPVEVPAVPLAYIKGRQSAYIAYNKAVDAADVRCQNAEDAAQRALNASVNGGVFIKDSAKMASSHPKRKDLEKYLAIVAEARAGRTAAYGAALTEVRSAAWQLEVEYDQPHTPVTALSGARIGSVARSTAKPRPFIAAS